MKTLHTIYTNFAKRLVISLMVLMTIGVGSVWGAEGDVVYTLSCVKNTSNSAYATYYDVTINSKTWNAPGNQTFDGYWRIGGKDLTKVDRTITGKSNIDKPIKKITINHKGKSHNSLTVNSVTITVATDASFKNVIDTKQYTPSITTSTTGNFDLEPSSSVWESGCYYKFTINVSNSSSSSNYGFDLSSIVFYEGAITPSCIEPKITTQPVSATYAKDADATALKVVASGEDLQYQWYSNASNSESGATKINNATSSTYTPVTSAAGTKYYYCIVSSGSCTTTSDIVPVIVNQTYTVTYNANGAESGTVPTDAINYTSGASVTVLGNTGSLVKAGYRFDGWQIDEAGTAYNAGDKFNISANTTLYAKWTERALTNYRTSCSSKENPNLSWSANSCVVTMEVDNEFPRLTNPYDLPVEYSSSAPAVATIDQNGNITLLSAGTTTITATYEENEDYLPASVSYTLTVKPSNCKWIETDITDINSGDKVVVTMTTTGGVTYALPSEQSTGSNPEAISVTVVDGNTLKAVPTTIVWIINKEDDNLTFESLTYDGYVLNCTNADDGVRVSRGSDKNKIFVIDPTSGYLKNTQTTDARYLGVHNTNHYWYCYKTYGNNTGGQTLKFYKKECLDFDEFRITYNLTGVTCTNPTNKLSNNSEDIELNFTANAGYQLPENITVLMGGEELDPNDNQVYIWEDGTILIDPSKVTGDIIITIEGCELLALPTNLKATNITSSSARLTWDEIEHAEQYQVHVTDDDDSTEDIITTTSSTYFEIAGLKSASPYLWGVTPIATGYCGITQEAEYFETLDVYTVTFNSNGGTVVEPQTVDAGSKITAPANPSADGYTFNYWYTTDANVSFDFNTPIAGNTTLNAKWTANVYTITFYKQSGTGGTDNATVTFNSNNYSVSTIEAPTRDKYEFSGYYTEQHGAGVQVVDTEGKWLKNVAGYTDANGNWIKAENTHLYAKWTAIHTITWVVNNNTETPYHTSTVLNGSTIDQLPTAPADDLFEDCDVNAFVGWSTDNIGLTPDAIAPTDLFKTVADAQSKIGAITTDKKFYAVYASTTNSTVTFDAADVSELTNNNLTWTHPETGISLALSAGQHYTNKTPYTFTVTNGTSNYCQITAPAEMLFSKVVVELSGSDYKVNSVSSGWSLSTSSTTQTITGSGTDLKMYATSSNQIRIKTAEVTYTTYTNFITRCTALPDPVWGGATIDNTVIPVNCGSTTSNSHAAQISFPTASNYNLYKDITIEVTSGNFIIASSRDGEYTTSETLSPTQSGDNAGTFANKYVYVRAVAPAQSDEDFTGTITISGKQIETQTINVTADVTCTQYTLTFNDQGQTKEVQGFAGTSVEAPAPWVGICTEPIQYVFDGWATAPVANGTEEYTPIDFSTYTMPDNNTTVLYAVYRYAEEGGEPVDGFVKVTEALSDWTGDYVIVDDEYNVAIKNAYKENTNSNKTLAIEEVTIESEKVVSPSANVIWALDKNGENYTMYNEVIKKYAGVSGSGTEKAILSADKHDIQIIFDSKTKIAKVYSVSASRCFEYYVANEEWRTYSSTDARYNTGYLYKLSNKSLLYTSSLVCGEISVEEDNVVVTSTKDQKVKVTVPIKVTSFYNDAVNVTGAGESTFSVATTENVAVNTDETTNIVLTYTPIAYNQLDNETITLTATNGATTTFQVKGRSLPETFAVVAKVGNMWYALPSQGLNSTTPPTAYPVEVDNIADPTEVTAVPANADWSLRQVHSSRYEANGHNLVFVNNEGTPKALNASKNTTYLLTDAQYANYHNSENVDRYEWTLSTNDLETYTLTNVNRSINVSINAATVFGTHSQNVASSELRFLPIAGRYTSLAAQVVEWQENSVVVMYNGNPAQTASTSINGAAAETVTLSEVQKDVAVYALPASNLTDYSRNSLAITIGSEKVILPIPCIVNGAQTDASLCGSSADIAKVSDLVILKGGTLTAVGTKSNPYKFRNVTVYGGGKLVVPADKGFGVNTLTLRIGGVTPEGNYDYVYPEFDLRGTFSNTSAKINLDYVTTKSQYYTFVAPFNINTKDIKYPVDIYGSNVAANNTGSFEFQYYDGAARANGEMGWKVVEEDPTNGATLTAHQGYTFYGMPKKVSVNGGSSTRQKFGIHRIPMSVTAANVMSHENSEQTTTVSAYPSQHNINAGWNLIGNPYMATITGLNNNSIQTGTIVLVDDRWQWSDAGSQANRFIVFPSNDGEWYYTSQASNATLPAFKNFFVQMGDKDATALSIPRTQAPAAQAPARRAAQEVDEDIELAIVLERDAAHADQLDFLINDAYSALYDHNADFTKMMNNTQLNLFGLLMEDNLSFVAVDHLTAKTDLAIGYQVPAAGEYTLRLSDKPYVMWSRVDALYVTDHEVYPELTTNLLEDDYTFQVGNAETNITRFTISIIPSKESSGTTTGVDNLLHHDMQTQKFIYNDQLYILRDGVVYDAMGQRIMTINK